MPERSHEQPLSISDEPKTTRSPPDGATPSFQFNGSGKPADRAPAPSSGADRRTRAGARRPRVCPESRAASGRARSRSPGEPRTVPTPGAKRAPPPPPPPPPAAAPPWTLIVPAHGQNLRAPRAPSRPRRRPAQTPGRAVGQQKAVGAPRSSRRRSENRRRPRRPSPNVPPPPEPPSPGASSRTRPPRSRPPPAPPLPAAGAAAAAPSRFRPRFRSRVRSPASPPPARVAAAEPRSPSSPPPA